MHIIPLLSSILIAQAQPAPEPQEIVQPQEVRPLPGGLDNVPMFNSNSPEKIGSEGILLSTFPPDRKAVPSAHLNFPFQGRFDIFAHHVFGDRELADLTPMYVGILVHNPTNEPVTLNILQGASYLSQPDAPFVQLQPLVANPLGEVFAGPGGRVTNEILRGQRQDIWPAQLVIEPQSSQMLMNLPIPVRTLEPPLNGRSTLLRLSSSGRVYVASLAMYARQDANGNERAPTLEEWQQLLQTADVATPRDRTPTPPDQTEGQRIYGRVAGVSQGSSWVGQVVDRPDIQGLSIPPSGKSFSYAIGTLPGGQMGTDQSQSAPMLVRYPDTAYSAHGNYALEYRLRLPLINETNATETVTVSLQTALKEETLTQQGLRFLEPPGPQVFFRGTVRVRYTNDLDVPTTRYWHLVQRRGQIGEPLVTLEMPPGSRRLVEVDLIYPPDATPPQVLTIQSR
ncbi:DUF3370 domain-containing protein [Laspinema sp. D6]|nr:DUF3370 domain-containing protein [Laspinema sp. D3a]MCT7989261.1 DUF3370 domain-containing protein [Laspinema sp. D3a]